jgi:rhodanese-related sulfurtransferase
MAESIFRDHVRRLVDHEHAQLVEVLPAAEYAWAHLAGAINLPLKKLDEQAVSVLDPRRPVIPYCNDFQ